MKNNVIVLLAVMAGMASCSKDDNSATPPAENTTTITVNFSGASPFTYFSFKDNAVVTNADTTGTKWDIAIRLTTILVNSHASGPGNAGVIVMDSIFGNVAQAPASGYAYDTAANRLAIKDGSWYNYNAATREFVPKAGKVFVFRTADGKFAKMEILAATYDAFVGPVPQKINYKMRIVYQTDGSGNLKK